ncbi:hypothetical protein QYM36_001476 [Artemia franciscana]|uniref:Uncharacterized protein n=1 Tax=Artemia franciscana TaxID=6661 RepID=A0AA88IE81_ARTSF|nr:hypothetical protein QYM36_001476 [Artemia franciscana]
MSSNIVATESDTNDGEDAASAMEIDIKEDPDKIYESWDVRFKTLLHRSRNTNRENIAHMPFIQLDITIHPVSSALITHGAKQLKTQEFWA